MCVKEVRNWQSDYALAGFTYDSNKKECYACKDLSSIEGNDAQTTYTILKPPAPEPNVQSCVPSYPEKVCDDKDDAGKTPLIYAIENRN